MCTISHKSIQSFIRVRDQLNDTDAIASASKAPSHNQRSRGKQKICNDVNTSQYLTIATPQLQLMAKNSFITPSLTNFLEYVFRGGTVASLTGLCPHSKSTPECPYTSNSVFRLVRTSESLEVTLNNETYSAVT